MLTCLCCFFFAWPFYLFFFLFSDPRLAKPVVKGVVATGAEGARGAAAGAVSGAIKGVLEGVAGSAPSAEHGAACAEKKNKTGRFSLFSFEETIPNYAGRHASFFF